VCGILLGPPGEYLDPSKWAARYDFLALLYEIFCLISKRRRLEASECNQVRLLTLRWGRAFLRAGFDRSDWTSKLHEFHEHVYWDLLRYSLYVQSSLAAESTFHIGKMISQGSKVFKRPRSGETRQVAGVRRIFGALWLRLDMDTQVAAMELPHLPSYWGKTATKFIRGRVVSDGDEKFELVSSDELGRVTSKVQLFRNSLIQTPLCLPPLDKASELRGYYSSLLLLVLKSLLKERQLPVSGKWQDLVERLVDFELKSSGAQKKSLPFQ
jgi:hypothetical protein